VFILLTCSLPPPFLRVIHNCCKCVQAKGATVVAVTCTAANQMSRAAHLAVCLPLERELCPFDLAPVTSTAIQMIFGDTLAVAIMNAKGVSRDEYSMNHPAGRIGKRLMLTVRAVMLTGDDLPIVVDQQVLAALPTLTAKACGCLLVVSATDKLLGIFTDGDLRRAVQTAGGAGLQQLLSDFMTTSFKSIGPDAMAVDALQVRGIRPFSFWSRSTGRSE
jgi:arabinose-5-phosphate isomerase